MALAIIILIFIVSLLILCSNFSICFYGIVEPKERMSEKEEKEYDKMIYINNHYVIV
jgi:hypothetical protein